MMTTFQRLWIQITSDRRRFGILCASLAVALLLWARIIVISKPPRTAIATQEQSEVSDARASFSGSSGDADNRPIRTQKVELSRNPTRDPFRINEQIFPKPSPIDQIPTDEGKSGAQEVEESRHAEQRRIAQWRALVESLTLEAVMNSSEQPMALINGRMYRQGSMVPAGTENQLAFRLEEVGERYVILSREEQRFQLKMSQPHER